MSGTTRIVGFSLILAALNACARERPAPHPAPHTATPHSAAPVPVLGPPGLTPEQHALWMSNLTGVAKHVGRAALTDTGTANQWVAECRIHRPCRPFEPLPTCSAGGAPLNAVAADELGGRPVVVRGELMLEAGYSSAVACPAKPNRPQFCCNGASNTALILVGGTPISLSGLGCGGDESRRCCGVPAFGQRVVASGYLGYTGEHLPSWRLKDAKLCTEASTTTK